MKMSQSFAIFRESNSSFPFSPTSNLTFSNKTSSPHATLTPSCQSEINLTSLSNSFDKCPANGSSE